MPKHNTEQNDLLKWGAVLSRTKSRVKLSACKRPAECGETKQSDGKPIVDTVKHADESVTRVKHTLRVIIDGSGNNISYPNFHLCSDTCALPLSSGAAEKLEHMWH